MGWNWAQPYHTHEACGELDVSADLAINQHIALLQNGVGLTSIAQKSEERMGRTGKLHMVQYNIGIEKIKRFTPFVFSRNMLQFFVLFSFVPSVVHYNIYDETFPSTSIKSQCIPRDRSGHT